MRCPSCGYELKQRKDRSNPENRYFHGVVLPILSQCEAFGGWTQEDIKEFLKEKFLSVFKTIKIGDTFQEVKVVRPSSSLSTIEWEKWMKEIRQWADLEIGAYLPEPNETIQKVGV